MRTIFNFIDRADRPHDNPFLDETRRGMHRGNGASLEVARWKSEVPAGAAAHSTAAR
jgi:hypothetical protein